MDDRLIEIREQLVDQLRRLNDEIEHGLDELGSRDDRHHIADLDDLAGDISSDSVLFEQFRSGGANREQIQRAIERVDAGNYELCEECEGPIGGPRLSALPFATHCIDCQRKLEIS